MTHQGGFSSCHSAPHHLAESVRRAKAAGRKQASTSMTAISHDLIKVSLLCNCCRQNLLHEKASAPAREDNIRGTHLCCSVGCCHLDRACCYSPLELTRGEKERSTTSKRPCKANGHANCRAKDEANDRANEQASKRSRERPGERPSERPSEQSGEWSSEWLIKIARLHSRRMQEK